MFILSLFTIGKEWNKPRCISTDECLKKMWHICTVYTVKVYSAKKEDEIVKFAGK